MMEFVTVFFPLYEIVVARREQTRSSGEDVARQRAGQYTTAALDEVLSNDPSSLLHFAAAKDFSGENIMFLNHIRDWKAAWVEGFNPRDIPQGDELRRHLFNVGVEIYVTYVNINTAEFPVNLEFSVYGNLANIFREAAKHIKLPETRNVITPFDTSAHTPTCGISMGALPRLCGTASSSSEAGDVASTSSSSTHNREDILFRGVRNIVYIKPRLPLDLEIPDDFNAATFDGSEHSIKTLVLRDTWPKYLDAKLELQRERLAAERAGNTWAKRFRFFGVKE